MPGASADAKSTAKVVDLQKIKETTIIVTAIQKNGNPIIEIEKTPVGLEELDNQLRKRVRDSKKVQMLIDACARSRLRHRRGNHGRRARAGIKRTMMAEEKVIGSPQLEKGFPCLRRGLQVANAHTADR